MAVAARSHREGGSACRRGRSNCRAQIAIARERTCGERLAGRRAGESDPQEPDSVAQDLLDRSGDAESERVRLAQYLYAHQKSGRIADCEIWTGASHRGGASRDCGNLRGETVSGLE